MRPLANFTGDFGVRTRLWEFGDGRRSRNPTLEYAWSQPGFYEVTLSVSDGTRRSPRRRGRAASSPRRGRGRAIRHAESSATPGTRRRSHRSQSRLPEGLAISSSGRAGAARRLRPQPGREERQETDGLLCSADGCRTGNDPSTVSGAAPKRFRIERIALVGDRGLTSARIREDVKPAGLDWISALKTTEIRKLLVARERTIPECSGSSTRATGRC